MISTMTFTLSTALTAPGAGYVDVRPRSAVAGVPAPTGCGPALALGVEPTASRAPAAFTAPFRGTGLPVLGRGVTGAVRIAQQVAPVDATRVPVGAPQHNTTHDTTTLGIRSPGRPPS